jgi:hypothetical protein
MNPSWYFSLGTISIRKSYISILEMALLMSSCLLAYRNDFSIVIETKELSSIGQVFDEELAGFGHNDRSIGGDHLVTLHLHLRLSS